jgi:hypothetical protein
MEMKILNDTIAKDGVDKMELIRWNELDSGRYVGGWVGWGG